MKASTFRKPDGNRNSALIVEGEPMKTGPRTYVVLGVMRGGTTMVGGIMRALGVFMGDNIDENNQESMDFHGRTPDQLAEVIARNNSNHQVWGWKHPNAADYLEGVWPHLVNPHAICVYRDAVANGQALNRWHPFSKMDAIQAALRRQQRNLNLVSKLAGPKIFVSYEKAERNKRLFLTEFSGLLGIRPRHDEFDFVAFMQSGSYKKLEDYRKIPKA